METSDVGTLKRKGHAPSLVSEMQDPVMNVLEGMRIQRMSLCQSLRQYLFVYRCESSQRPFGGIAPSLIDFAHHLTAIIIGFLDMLDEEREALHADQGRFSATHSVSGSSAGLTDEEGHHKRRASPTDLAGSRLQKRPSIKLRSNPVKSRGQKGPDVESSPNTPPMPARNSTPSEVGPDEQAAPPPLAEFHRPRSGLSYPAVSMDTDTE